MANIKILKIVKEEGYCCAWAYFEAHRAVKTSELIKEFEGICKLNALQKQRHAHRHGETKCLKLETCLKELRKKT